MSSQVCRAFASALGELQPWSPSLGGLRQPRAAAAAERASATRLQPWSPSLGGLRRNEATGVVPVLRHLLQPWSPSLGGLRHVRLTLLVDLDDG